MRNNSAAKKISAVREVLSGSSIKEVSKKYNCSRQSLYSWIKKYQENPDNARASLKNSYKAGKKHYKSLSWKAEKLVLDLAIKEPNLGLRRLKGKFAEAGFKISEHGIYNILLRYELQTKELRHRFSFIHPVKTLFATSIVPAYRVRAIEEYIKEGKKISQICRAWKISRVTFYAWLKRYQSALASDIGDAGTIEALARNYKSGWDNLRSCSQSARDLVRDIVIRNPEYSVHKIYAEVARVDGKPAVGHHGIQNILKREDLNTYEKRLRFAQGVRQVPEAAIAPLYSPEIPLYKLRHILAHFATVPKLLLTDPKRGAPYAAGIFSSLLLLFLWLRLLFTTPNASPFGLFFSSIALTFGLFFFIYSMKYYITVLLVLRLAQGGGSNVPSQLETRIISALSRVPGLGGIARAAERQRDTSAVNPLTLNLDKITLRTHPFVSIHVALYNEKRVVERLIRACEAQEYYEGTSITSSQGTTSTTGGDEKARDTRDTLNARGTLAAYEVIIADDSTDETTAIAKEILSSGGRILDRTRKDEEMEVYVSSPLVGSSLPVIKLIHRFSRSGFKGAALQRALENTNPKAVYISVFDADFVPYPDTITQFVKTFQELNSSITSGQGTTSTTGSDEMVRDTRDTLNARGTSNIAAVQGYQWHVLNKSQTWITRGVRTEYAGSYVIERAGEEIYGGLKQIAGSVYAIRADILRQFGWGTSITEDFELTLRLYERGYKVAFTPYIQAPAEAVSTIKRLVRQRMRWAEGASYNIKVMLPRLLFGHWEAIPQPVIANSTSGVVSPTSVIARNEVTKQSDEEIATSLDELGTRNDNESGDGTQGRVWRPSGLTKTEKLEFAYLAPYYLQAAFFVVGTFSWFISEAILGSRLPFWTAALGWSLVFTNILALPLMNIVGLFLEESDERDYIGVLSFIVLSYIVVPFQAYAAIKGFLETEEGPWFRTPKTGIVTDTFGRSGFSKFFGDLLGKKPQTAEMSRESGGSKGSWMMGIPKPALAFRPLGVNRFPVRRRRMRSIGSIALGFLLIITISLSSISSFIPFTKDVSAQSTTKVITASGSQSQSESKEEINSQVMARFGQVEAIFHEEPRVRYKSAYGEVELTTQNAKGLKQGRERSAYQQGPLIVYPDIFKDADLIYRVRETRVIESLRLNSYQAFEYLEQRVRLNDLTMVKSDLETISIAPKNGGGEIFRFGKPFMYEEGNPSIRSEAIVYELEGNGDEYILKKVLTAEGKQWLSDPQRTFPVIIDPSINISNVVASAVVDGDAAFGSNERKIAYMPNATGGAAWYAFHSDGDIVRYKKCAVSTACDADLDWSANVAVDVDGDGGDINPTIWVTGDSIWVAWIDNATVNTNTCCDEIDSVQFRALNTTDDTFGGECGTFDQTSLDATNIPFIAAGTNGDLVVGYSDTAGDAEADIFESASDRSCTSAGAGMSSIETGSGLCTGTCNTRPVAVAAGNNIHVIYEDGANVINHSLYDVSGNSWTFADKVADNGNVVDDIFSVTTDGSSLWLLYMNTATTTVLQKCTGTCMTASGGAWSNLTAPWTSGVFTGDFPNLTYFATENDLRACIVDDPQDASATSEDIVCKDTDASSISWETEFGIGFTQADFAHLSTVMSVTDKAAHQFALVTRDATNSTLKFATVPERSLLLLVTLPFVMRLFSKYKKRRGNFKYLRKIKKLH